MELKYWGLMGRYSTKLGVDQEESPIHHHLNIDQSEFMLDKYEEQMMIFVNCWDLYWTTKRETFWDI